MKKFMVMAAGLMMAAVLGACAPTARNTGETSEHETAVSYTHLTLPTICSV